VEGIVKHLGIALHSRDASLVAATDPEELKRLREGFLKKKLVMTRVSEVLSKRQSVSSVFALCCAVASTVS